MTKDSPGAKVMSAAQYILCIMGSYLVGAAGISEGSQNVGMVQLTADQGLQSWGPGGCL